MEIEIEAEDNGASAARSQELTLEDEALSEGETDGQIVKVCELLRKCCRRAEVDFAA